MDKLKNRGMQLVNRCFFCKAQEESTEHLFVACQELQQVWSYFGQTMGLDFSPSKSLFERLNAKLHVSATVEGRFFGDDIFHAIVWGIWLERNKRCFEGKERNKARIINDIKFLIWGWGLNTAKGRTIMLDTVMCGWDDLVRNG